MVWVVLDYGLSGFRLRIRCESACMTISTRRLRARPAAVALLAIGRCSALPEAVSRLAPTPCAIRKRTTVLARAVESSQLLGNSAAVDRARCRCCLRRRSGASGRCSGGCAISLSSAVGPGFERRLAGGEQEIVGEHPDDQAARFDRRLDALGEAVAARRTLRARALMCCELGSPGAAAAACCCAAAAASSWSCRARCCSAGVLAPSVATGSIACSSTRGGRG